MPRMSLELVVVAIVILVVALVILTIFGTGISPFGSFSSTRNLCVQQYGPACQSTGADPIDWTMPKYKDPSSGVMQSCKFFASTCACHSSDATHPLPYATC